MKRVTALAIAISVILVGGVAGAKEGGKMIENGRTVSFDYTLTVNGEVVESSDRGGKPLTYVHGSGSLIPGLESQLLGMKEGDGKTITVAAEDAYGVIDPKAFQEVEKERLPQDPPLEVGTQLQAKTVDGRVTIVTVSEVKGDTVILNFNHPLAGKTLQFEVKILTIQ